MEYSHSEAPSNPSVIGGYVYHGARDQCFNGKYIFADYGLGLMLGIESGPGSGVFSRSRLNMVCATSGHPAGTCSTGGKTTAFGEDAAGDLYVVLDTRVLRVVDRTRCPSLPDCNFVTTGTTGAIGTCNTYSASNLNIPIQDNQQSTSQINVPGSFTTALVEVASIVGTHTYIGDLTFSIASPSGQTVTLLAGQCGSAHDFNFGFADSAPSSLDCSQRTQGTSWRPANPLSALQGVSGGGNWVLTVADNAGGDTGTLASWSIRVCTTDTTGQTTTGTPATTGTTGSTGRVSGTTGTTGSVSGQTTTGTTGGVSGTTTGTTGSVSGQTTTGAATGTPATTAATGEETQGTTGILAASTTDDGTTGSVNEEVSSAFLISPWSLLLSIFGSFFFV